MHLIRDQQTIINAVGGSGVANFLGRAVGKSVISCYIVCTLIEASAALGAENTNSSNLLSLPEMKGREPIQCGTPRLGSMNKSSRTDHINER